MTQEQTLNIAAVAHEANRMYCLTLGDTSQLPWTDAPEWQRSSAILGVRNIVVRVLAVTKPAEQVFNIVVPRGAKVVVHEE